MAGVLADLESSALPEKDKALFRLLRKVNADARAITRAEVEAVRAAGWSDEAIFDAITVCSLFNFYNLFCDATLARWAVDLQNDFRARMDWCVEPFERANHPPRVALAGEAQRTVTAGAVVTLDVRGSHGPDAGQQLQFSWWQYREPGTFDGAVQIEAANEPVARLIAPAVTEPRTIHLVATVRDNGSPPLARYARVVVTVMPRR